MRKLATLICLILIATACSNDSDSEEVSELKEKVSTLEKKLGNTVNESKSDSVWNSDYQETWMEVCETILEYEEENNLKASASKVCRCSLDGLMFAFTLKEYESWPQNVKDGAAAPYVHRCWPS